MYCSGVHPACPSARNPNRLHLNAGPRLLTSFRVLPLHPLSLVSPLHLAPARGCLANLALRSDGARRLLSRLASASSRLTPAPPLLCSLPPFRFQHSNDQTLLRRPRLPLELSLDFGHTCGGLLIAWRLSSLSALYLFNRPTPFRLRRQGRRRSLIIVHTSVTSSVSISQIRHVPFTILARLVE